MRIGLTYADTEEKYLNYVRWLQGDRPEEIEVVRLSVQEDNLAALGRCDALVLSGGRDIQPLLYKNPKTDYDNAPRDFDVARDRFEASAYSLAQERKLPVLGICRGMQLVNCVQGGTLRQDLGVDLNEIHRALGADKTHGVTIEPQSLLYTIAGSTRGWTNSAHHQAVEQLGAGLKVNCRAGDGTIEGLEWADPEGKPFLLCVQWHPERMEGDAPLSAGIRHSFIQAI